MKTDNDITIMLLMQRVAELEGALTKTKSVLSARFQNIFNGHWDDGELQLLAQHIDAALAAIPSAEA